jgi:hypothetical protein
MTAVTAVVVCCGRAFSSVATARVVGDVGGGRDGPPRPLGCRAVMIARARASYRFSVVGPPVSGRCSRLQLMRAARAVRGAWLPQIYKSKKREGEVPYLIT